MFIIRVKPVIPFFEAISPLTRISTQADLKFSPQELRITVFQHSPRLVAMLQLTSQHFSSFLVTRNLTARINLDTFHSTLMAANNYPAITINFLENKMSLLLRFENSKNRPVWREELELLPSEEEEVDVSKIDFTNSVSIDSTEFLRIVQDELSVTYQDRICVTLTNSQVKFTAGAKEVILSKEDGEFVLMDGQEDLVDKQFHFTIHPMTFFGDLTDRSRRVWFLNTTNSESIICVPSGLFTRYMMYFPST